MPTLARHARYAQKDESDAPSIHRVIKRQTCCPLVRLQPRAQVAVAGQTEHLPFRLGQYQLAVIVVVNGFVLDQIAQNRQETVLQRKDVGHGHLYVGRRFGNHGYLRVAHQYHRQWLG